MKENVKNADKISSYIKADKFTLIMLAVSGTLFNVGLLSIPFFDGLLVQALYDIIVGKKSFSDMIITVSIFFSVMLVVQLLRYLKRFYVRRFTNNIAKSLRCTLYNKIIRTDKAELEKLSVGGILARAVSDIDSFSEGVRNFSAGIFDTGVLLIGSIGMLCYYDVKLALIALAFAPLSYIIAALMKTVVYKRVSSYRKSVDGLTETTLDRCYNAVTYRVFSRERAANKQYESRLNDYTGKAIRANVFENSLQPIYKIIALIGVIFIVYFGGRNVIGIGWQLWDVAAFTTFLATFNKIAEKSSKGAKLFNSVQRARISWIRIKTWLKPLPPQDKKITIDLQKPVNMSINGLFFAYENGKRIFENINFTAVAGEIIGVTGHVASGKTTFGLTFLCERDYGGSIKIYGKELSEFTPYERSLAISYLGHKCELITATIHDNICLGEDRSPEGVLKAVCLDKDLALMQGENTFVGSRGDALSGGQRARVALARTLYHLKKVVILDDPFSSLDKNTEAEILANIKELAKESIVILISHRLTAFKNFDKVIWLGENGAKVSDHETLFSSNEDYRRQYSVQLGEAKNG